MACRRRQLRLLRLTSALVAPPPHRHPARYARRTAPAVATCRGSGDVMWSFLLLSAFCFGCCLAYRADAVPLHDDKGFTPFAFTQPAHRPSPATAVTGPTSGQTRTTSLSDTEPPSTPTGFTRTGPTHWRPNISLPGGGMPQRSPRDVAGRQGGGVVLPCDSHVLQPGSYVITHPGAPGPYPNGQDCAYSLSSGPGWPMELHCTQFALESHSTCDWDWLAVDGVKFCGSSGPPAATRVQFQIAFHSDSSVTADGYRCEIEVPEVAPCGTYTLPPGTYYLQSSGYPGQYPNDLNCTWSLTTAGAGDLMSLSCDAFTVESHSTCGYDWLQVEGARYCGFQPPPQVRTVNSLAAAFHSDYLVTEDGFRCAVTVTNNTCCGVGGGGSRIIGGAGGSRVVGGLEATPHALPWQAALVDPGGSAVFCGASLISDRHLLTAAHCVDSRTPAQLEVLLREHDTTAADGELRRAVSAVQLFPGYTQPWAGGDFALVHLTQPVTFGDGVRPACLPPAGSLFSDASALVSGWGVTGYPDGDQPTALQQAEVQVLSPAQCAASYVNITAVTESMVCAAGAGGRDACTGDSGGPLVTAVGGRAVLVGVTSFGVGCGGQYPGVYGRVTTALGWIAERTSDDVYC